MVISVDSDYIKYRGKCREYCEAAIKEDPTLTIVRGHYFCPMWNTDEQHWWCVKPDGTIVDPTARQFPSKGHGVYTPFNGYITCEECSKEVAEANAYIQGCHTFCSSKCFARCVGIDF